MPRGSFPHSKEWASFHRLQSISMKFQVPGIGISRLELTKPYLFCFRFTVLFTVSREVTFPWRPSFCPFILMFSFSLRMVYFLPNDWNHSTSQDLKPSMEPFSSVQDLSKCTKALSYLDFPSSPHCLLGLLSQSPVFQAPRYPKFLWTLSIHFSLPLMFMFPLPRCTLTHGSLMEYLQCAQPCVKH